MIDAELSRPPMAELNVTAYRVGNHIESEVKVTNRSGNPLASSGTDATVVLIVYEDVIATPVDSGQSITGRIERAVVSVGISYLDNNATGYFYPMTLDLTTVQDWGKIHVLALVEYRPGGATGAYDTLQAAFAVNPTFTVEPASLSFNVGPVDFSDPTASLAINGSPQGQSWSVQSKPAWVTVTPASDWVPRTAQVKVSVKDLPNKNGLNSGSIVIASQYGGTKTIPIQVTYTPPSTMTVAPTSMTFIIDQTSPADKETPLQITGYPASLAWNVTAKPEWLSMPMSGVVGSPVLVKVEYAKLAWGSNTGEIRLHASAPEKEINLVIPVSVTYGTLYSLYTPMIVK